VKLVKNSKHAKRLVKKAFGRGFSQFDRLNHLKLRYNNFAGGKEDFVGFMKGAARSISWHEYQDIILKIKVISIFQDFIPNNKFDTRIVVVGGEKAIGEIRFVRKGDFQSFR
jgi:hypothetical protein